MRDKVRGKTARRIKMEEKIIRSTRIMYRIRKKGENKNRSTRKNDE